MQWNLSNQICPLELGLTFILPLSLWLCEPTWQGSALLHTPIEDTGKRVRERGRVGGRREEWEDKEKSEEQEVRCIRYVLQSSSYHIVIFGSS